MRNTEMICRNCVYKYTDEHGNEKCEKNGRRVYWNKQTCPDHIETATSYWKDQKPEKKK